MANNTLLYVVLGVAGAGGAYLLLRRRPSGGDYPPPMQVTATGHFPGVQTGVTGAQLGQPSGGNFGSQLLSTTQGLGTAAFCKYVGGDAKTCGTASQIAGTIGGKVGGAIQDAGEWAVGAVEDAWNAIF